MSDIELGNDMMDEMREIRREEEIREWMEETGCSREVAEFRVECSIGSNPDSYYGPIY